MSLLGAVKTLLIGNDSVPGKQYGNGLIAQLAGGTRVPSAPPSLFAGSSHPDLAAKIASSLGIDLGPVTLKTFADGESYCRYDESVRGTDLFIVQSCAGYGKVNDYLFELLALVNAAKLASAKRVTVVLPYYPYSRADRKAAAREPIAARLVADLLEAAGVNRVIAMDLHAGQLQGFFSIPVDHVSAIPSFVNYLKTQGLEGEKVVVVSPDAGRAKVARRFAARLNCEMAMLNKHRPAHDQVEVSHLIGDVAGKVCVMTDDIIATGSTLAAGATALKEAGATAVYACATHGLFPDGSLAKLTASDFEQIIVTDTVCAPEEPCDKLVQISVADILAQAVANVWAGESISSIFEGENLF